MEIVRQLQSVQSQSDSDSNEEGVGKSDKVAQQS